MAGLVLLRPQRPAVEARRAGRHVHVRHGQHRARARLTQAELADLVRVSRKTINTVENGVFTPSATLALLLARALGVPVEALFFLDEAPDRLTAANSGKAGDNTPNR